VSNLISSKFKSGVELEFCCVVCGRVAGLILSLAKKSPAESILETINKKIVNHTIIQVTIIKYCLVSFCVGHTTCSNSLIDSFKKLIINFG
jgi:hypothetical protein